MGITSTAVLGGISVILLVVASAFFSSSETAIFSLPGELAVTQAGTEDPRALALRNLRANPHRLLVTLLVGNNLVNIAISSVITASFASHFSPGLAVAGATIVASSVVLVFGEIVPKSYGLSNAKQWSLTVARPLQYVEQVLYPLVIMFDGITRGLNNQLNADRDIEETYIDG